MWRVDGKLDLESNMAGESNIVTNNVNYTVGLGHKQAEVNISQVGGTTPDGKTDFSESATLISAFSQFNSTTGSGSVTLSQSLGVSSSAFVIGGSPPPYDHSADGNANFQNTAQSSASASKMPMATSSRRPTTRSLTTRGMSTRF